MQVKFDEFNIIDMVKTASSCPICWKGLHCTEHDMRRKSKVLPTMRAEQKSKLAIVRERRLENESMNPYD